MLTFATMKFRTVIYTLLLATLCMGCGGSISMRQLEQLEVRVNDVPDSVLRVLTATDMPPELQGSCVSRLSATLTFRGDY